MIFRRIQFIQLRLIIKISGSSLSLVLLHHWLYDRKDVRPVQTLPAIRLCSLLGDSWDWTYDAVISRIVGQLNTTKSSGDIDSPGIVR